MPSAKIRLSLKSSDKKRKKSNSWAGDTLAVKRKLYVYHNERRRRKGEEKSCHSILEVAKNRHRKQTDREREREKDSF